MILFSRSLKNHELTKLKNCPCPTTVQLSYKQKVLLHGTINRRPRVLEDYEVTTTYIAGWYRHWQLAGADWRRFSCVLKIVKSWVVSIVMSTTTNQPHMPSNPSSEVSIEEIGAEEELAQCEKDRDDVRHGWVKVIYSYYPCVKRHYQNCFKSTKGGPTSNKIRALVGSKSEASNQKSVLSTSGCMLAKNMYGWT